MNEDADRHYEAALDCEDAGDFDGMRDHFLEVLRIESALDRPSAPDELDFIEATAEAVLANVPDEFRRHLANIPIVLEDRPARAAVEEGFDPRALGQFEGFEHAEQQLTEPGIGLHLAPTRIVLYHRNLLAAFPDRDALAREVEITLLHEIGHFFGLDEDGVDALGLR